MISVHCKKLFHFPSTKISYVSKNNRKLKVQAVSNSPSIPKKIGNTYVYGGQGTIKGICHFIGGAFVGATPQLAYPLLLQCISNAGYTIIVTPFNVTFNHKECALKLHQDFWNTMDILNQSSEMSNLAPSDKLVHGIGHSFGALAHALISSISPLPHNASNVLISFNNKDVSDAIPIPGLVENVQNFIKNYEFYISNANLNLDAIQSQIPSIKKAISNIAELEQFEPIKEFINTVAVDAVDPAINQLDSLFSELKSGNVDFTPSPEQSQLIIKDKYKVKSSYLIKFKDDTIDETNILKDILLNVKYKIRNVQILEIDGNHVTPCGGDVKWFDMDTTNTFNTNDIYDLSRKIVDWLNSFELL